MVSVSPGEEGSQFNLAAQGRRQAGSSFKTFVLTEAIRRGINPDTTTYLSAPFTWQPDPQSVPWDVHTYSNTYNGPSTITDATLRSDNTVYARLTLDLGPESVAKLANEMGVRSPLKPVASIGLGTNDVTVLDMASAYATLAAGGVYHEPIAIRKVAFPNGEVVSGADALQLPAPRRVLTDGVAYQVTRVLEKNVLAGTGTAAYFGRPAAGKTGTTDDYTDAWFCGYTPTLATAVWVGYPNAKVSMTNVHGITVAGGTFPARIWHDFVSQALASVPPLDFPLPKEEPVWRPWKGQFAFAGDTSTTETDTAQTDTAETKPGTGHQAPPPPTVVTIPPTTSPPTSPPPTTAPGTTTEGPAPPPPPPQN
jgi:penicillin-binding protein 1A